MITENNAASVGFLGRNPGRGVGVAVGTWTDGAKTGVGVAVWKTTGSSDSWISGAGRGVGVALGTFQKFGAARITDGRVRAEAVKRALNFMDIKVSFGPDAVKETGVGSELNESQVLDMRYLS